MGKNWLGANDKTTRSYRDQTWNLSSLAMYYEVNDEKTEFIAFTVKKKD